MIITAEQRTDGCYNIVQVLEVIKDLAKSQGFYSRLYERIEEMQKYDPFNFQTFKSIMEQQNFKDPVDIVLFFES
jgi:hypothetical protein